MVWFQCEDCGDNLKKPKLPNHFRVCSAFKLSCIDCGQVFGKHDVEYHTQCITEEEKYGPKGQTKATNGSNAKSNNDSKPKPVIDINVGLSDRPPWFCSLCNTKATSKQTLLLHADGKKHGGKARAFHASKQPPIDTTETKDTTGNNETNKAPEIKSLLESKGQNSSENAPVVPENDTSKSNKKRKHQGSDNGTELGNGEVLHIKGEEKVVKKNSKKAKESATKDDQLDSTSDKDLDQKIKWKKLITTALKSNADGVLKLKQLRKSVMKLLEESGITENKKQVTKFLEEKINSSPKFILDGKHVRLTASS